MSGSGRAEELRSGGRRGGTMPVALALLAIPLWSAERPTIDLAATPATVNVGDSVVVTITYRWPAGWTAEHEPEPALDFQQQFVTDAPPVQRVSTAQEERRTARLTLSAVSSGPWLLPRPSVTLRGPDGPVTVQAPEVIVQVGTEAAPPTLPKAIAPLVRPPADIARTPPWWWIGGATLIVLAAAVLIWRLRRPIRSVVTPANRFATAVQAVTQLREGKDAGAALSLALRTYAGEMWRFDGPGSTTREVAAALSGERSKSSQRGRHGITEGERSILIRLLDRMDDLRWSPEALPVEVITPLIEESRTLVDAVEQRLAKEREREREERREQQPERTDAAVGQPTPTGKAAS